METTKNIQQLLFRSIDCLDPESFSDAVAVREYLMETALDQIPYLYDAVCDQIDMLVAEYCGD